MNHTYQRWACGFLAALLAFLSACAGIIYAVDPCFYYRMPSSRQLVFFNERYQAAGLAKNVPAETVLLGTSMAANYRASWIEEFYQTSGLRITIPDGYFSEFDKVMALLFRKKDPPVRILFALDLNTLIRDGSGVTSAMPEYFYNQNPLDDVQYLLNKDSLYYSLYAIMTDRQGGGETLDEGFTWDKTSDWGRYETLRNYARADVAEEPAPEDAYLKFTEENVAVMESWFQAHPDVKFELFLSPYSILAWDRAIRQGDLDARLTALERACEILLSYDNVRVHAPLFAVNLVTNLDNYCDYVHHSGEAGEWVLGNVCAGNFVLEAETLKKTLADWRAFVVNYDYDSFWDQDFWDQWNAAHDAPPAWWKDGQD